MAVRKQIWTMTMETSVSSDGSHLQFLILDFVDANVISSYHTIRSWRNLYLELNKLVTRAVGKDDRWMELIIKNMFKTRCRWHGVNAVSLACE